MHRGLLIAIVMFAFLLAAPSPAWANDSAGEGQAAAKQEGGGLNVFEGALDLTIWTIVVFLVLLFVLSKYAWKPMLQGLEQREKTVHAAVEEAQRAREEAQHLRDQLRSEMDKAQEQVRQTLEQGRRDAQRVADETLAKAKSEIQTERDRLHREIDLARDQALQQIWGQAATLAARVSSKAIRRQLTPDDHRRLVDEALAELRQAKGGDGASV
jgi:F-type H+-transporting ATPase subunit b